jgi:plastocyanin
MKLRPWLLTATTAALLAVSSCGSDNTTNPNPNPNPNPGGPNPTFNSGNLNTSAPTNVFVFTFPDSGSFGYRCTIHAGMNGTVVVSSAGADSPVVNVTSNAFTPNPVNVKTGSYVKWTNTQGVHTVTRP